MHALFHVHCDFDFSFFLLSIISLLIRAGTSILNVFVFLSLNGICSDGIDICLICTSENGHLEVVKYLHEECHANVEAKDKYGRTPIICASQSGHLEVVKYLHEECHADVEAKDNNGYTSIIRALLRL